MQWYEWLALGLFSVYVLSLLFWFMARFSLALMKQSGWLDRKD